MATNKPLYTAADEVAAAEAELKAAQEKLDAAKAKLAETSSDANPIEDGAAAVVAVDEAPSGTEPSWVPYSTAPMPASQASPQATPTQPQTPGDTPEQPGGASPAPGATAPAQPASGYTAPGYTAPQTPPHAGPGAVPPQQPYYGYQQPYYQQPYYQQPYGQPMITTKDHVAAGLLAIFLGAFGIHKFYLGYNTSGFIMLAVAIIGGAATFTLAFWVIWVIAIIEGILYLTKSQTEFEQAYVLNKRDWF